MTDLLDLAGRCEKATGPDRELDAAIDVAVRGGPAANFPAWVYTNFPTWRARAGGRVEVVHDDGTGGVQWTPKPYTASIDAAMTLVPEGWDWWCGSKSQGGLYRMSIHGPVQFGNVCEMEAGSSPSRALALCAAALRARAMSLGGEDRG